jgi:hypothetical protein
LGQPALSDIYIAAIVGHRRSTHHIWAFGMPFVTSPIVE